MYSAEISMGTEVSQVGLCGLRCLPVMPQKGAPKAALCCGFSPAPCRFNRRKFQGCQQLGEPFHCSVRKSPADSQESLMNTSAAPRGDASGFQSGNRM